ncbi:MAG: hypothetical protein GC162_17600 [Planctomycetes bacterium]|nr:hypothetical protein [Planctomycetota bacterium]
MADTWRLLTQTCLRVGEFIWLRKEDVIHDPAGRAMALNICKKVCPFTQQFWQPKHGRERIVPITGEAAAIVMRALATSRGPWLFEPADSP